MNERFSPSTWQSLAGRIEPHRNKLSEEIATQINGQREIVVAKLQERFGFTEEQAEHVLDDFLVKSR